MTLYRYDRDNANEKLFADGLVPKRGGGIAIYVKACWVPFVTVYTAGTSITEDFEIISLIIDKPEFKKLFISAIYKPPNGKINKCLSFLEGIIGDAEIRKREKWILGDFNINLHNRNTPDAMLVNGFLKKNTLKQLITAHTRLTNRGGSCIDWVITDCPYVSHSGVLDELLSDHFSIFAIRKKHRETITKKWKRIRIYKNFDREVFHTLLVNDNWRQYYILRDVNLLWSMIYTRIIQILEIMCPYKNVCLRDPRTPWITAQIVKTINERKKYLRMFRKTMNANIWEICKYLRNKCNSLIQTAKTVYIKNNLQRNADDPRKFWRSINVLLKGPKTDVVAHEFVDGSNGNVILHDDVCDYLNNFYATIGMANLNVVTERPVWDVEGPGHVFDYVTHKETTDLIREIDIGKDSCVEGVVTSILKHGFTSLSNQLQYLFNVSLEEGTFPREWAKGFINILPKGGNLKDPSNWRPITQTLLPAKMLEKIVQKRFYNILTRINYLNANQFGFIPGRSTQFAIFNMLKDIYDAKNSKLNTGLLFLDVKKAFDSLDHNILLSKIKSLGVSGKMLTWFNSYLDRTQRVRHNGNVSNEVKFQCGIPQGSCLGPTLFVFYINDVFRSINENVNIMMFADDCVLYNSHESCDNVLDDLQIGLDNYVEWGRKNNMHLNAGKTKAMLITSTIQYNLYPPLVTAGRNIQYVNVFNYLGVLLDSQLSYTSYCQMVKRKMENKIFVLSKIRKYVDDSTAILIYKQAVLPLVEYAGFILGSCTIGQRQELQTIQNNALRLCKRYFLLDMIRIRDLHAECTLLGLEQRRRKQLLRLMYLHSKDESNIKQPARLTREASKIVFKIPSRCTDKYMRSPFYKGNILWNQLDVNVQKICNVTKFTEALNTLYVGYQEIW